MWVYLVGGIFASLIGVGGLAGGMFLIIQAQGLREKDDEESKNKAFWKTLWGFTLALGQVLALILMYTAVELSGNSMLYVGVGFLVGSFSFALLIGPILRKYL